MIQVIERFNRIMHYVADHPERPCRIKELRELLGVSQPTCSNIVRCMVELNYLEPAPNGGGYILGPCPSLLVRHGTYKQYLVKVAEPLLEDLVERINETCLITSLSNSQRVVLLSRESRRSVQSGNADVLTGNLTATATGTIMLAYMQPRELEAYIGKTPFSGSVLDGVGNWGELQERLPLIRSQQCCWHVSGERLDQRAALAVPIMNHGRLDAVLGCWLPGLRFTDATRQALIRECADTACAITRQVEKICQ